MGKSVLGKTARADLETATKTGLSRKKAGARTGTAPSLCLRRLAPNAEARVKFLFVPLKAGRYTAAIVSTAKKIPLATGTATDLDKEILTTISLIQNLISGIIPAAKTTAI